MLPGQRLELIRDVRQTYHKYHQSMPSQAAAEATEKELHDRFQHGGLMHLGTIPWANLLQIIQTILAMLTSLLG
jgi:hypothetical protein